MNELLKTIKKRMIEYDVDMNQLSEILKIPKSTLYLRYKCPETFRLGELEMICKLLHMELKIEAW